MFSGIIHEHVQTNCDIWGLNYLDNIWYNSVGSCLMVWYICWQFVFCGDKSFIEFTVSVPHNELFHDDKLSTLNDVNYYIFA